MNGPPLPDQLTPAEARTLEDLLDRVGLATLAGAIACLCEAKHDHATANWQDRNLARAWTDISTRFTIIENAARREGL